MYQFESYDPVEQEQGSMVLNFFSHSTWNRLLLRLRQLLASLNESVTKQVLHDFWPTNLGQIGPKYFPQEFSVMRKSRISILFGYLEINVNLDHRDLEQMEAKVNLLGSTEGLELVISLNRQLRSIINCTNVFGVFFYELTQLLSSNLLGKSFH